MPPDPVDVKPIIRPSPPATPARSTISSPSKASPFKAPSSLSKSPMKAASQSAKSPSKPSSTPVFVKKEPGLPTPITRTPVMIGSPISISSDSDDEVDAQMDRESEQSRDEREEDKGQERKDQNEDEAMEENEGDGGQDEVAGGEDDNADDRMEGIEEGFKEKILVPEPEGGDEDQIQDDSDGDMYQPAPKPAQPQEPSQNKAQESERKESSEEPPQDRHASIEVPAERIPTPEEVPADKEQTPPPNQQVQNDHADPLERRSSSPEDLPCSQALLNQLRPRRTIPKAMPKPKMRQLSASQPTPLSKKRMSSDFLRRTMVGVPPASQPAPTRPTFLEPAKRSISVHSDNSDNEPQSKRVKHNPSSSPQRHSSEKPLPESTQPRKPSRTESPSIMRKSRPKKDPEFWLLDGSVVLEVEDTRFRLHQSRLMQGSTFLAEMFASPNGKGYFVEEREGCAVYRVGNLSVADMKCLLRAFDKSVEYFFTPPGFDELAGILRAARALSFNRYEDFATRFLREMWPADLAQPATGDPRHAEETIVLARTCGLPELLKRAFYVLLCAPDLGQGQPDDEVDYEGEDDAPRSRLSRADLARLIRVRANMHEEWHRGAGLPPDPNSFPCPLSASPETRDTEPAKRCADATAHSLPLWREKVVRSGLFAEYMNDPVTGLARLAELDWHTAGFCEGCVKAFRDAWLAQKRKLWMNLDLWLELPAAGEEVKE